MPQRDKARVVGPSQGLRPGPRPTAVQQTHAAALRTAREMFATKRKGANR